MKTNNKIIKYYENEVKRLRLKVAQAQKEYNDIIDLKLRFFLQYGFFHNDYKDMEKEAYLKLAQKTCDLVAIETKLLIVKALELCQTEKNL